MRVLDCIEYVEQRLLDADLTFGHGTDNPADEAVYLVLGSLKIDFDCSEQELLQELDQESEARIEQALRQRIEQRMPVAYLVGEAWFAGYGFKIDRRALIPRSPIAELINNEFQPLLKAAPERILDLCTGCGCIGIASALQFKEATVDLLDISADALELARDNIERYKLAGRVSTIESDLFDKVQSNYDLILANPPYVGVDEYRELPKEFQHEPELGLLTEDNGLQIPLRILREAPDYMTENSFLIMEVGYSQQALSARCAGVPFLWLEFAYGGEGVLALSRAQLLQYRECFI